MPVRKGNKVKLHLSGKLKDGKVFATTEGKEPVEFTAGAGEILPGIDDEVIGMEKGEEREIMVPPERGFGKRKEELVIEVPKDKFEEKPLKVGEKVSVKTQQGRTKSAQVRKIGKDTVTLDLNHPLSGKETLFRMKVVDIK